MWEILFGSLLAILEYKNKKINFKYQIILPKFEKLNKSLIRKNEIEDFIKFNRYLFSHKRKSLKTNVSI